MLRIYSLPYIDYRINSKHFFFAHQKTQELIRNDDSLSMNRQRGISTRIIISLAFADLFGFENQFMKKQTKSFLYNQPIDYRLKGSSYCVVPGKVSDKLDLTGPRVRFKVSKRSIMKTPADYYVLAAFNVPYVQFIGWALNKDFLANAKGYSCYLYAGSPKVRSLETIPLCKDMKKGKFI